MKKQKAHGCQYTNAYLASIPSELRVIIGAHKADVEALVELVTETSINQVFSRSVHVIARYDVIDLREANIKAEQPTEEALVADPAQTASNENTVEVTNETLPENGDKPTETAQSSGQTEGEAQNGDTYQSLKRKRGGRKSAS